MENPLLSIAEWEALTNQTEKAGKLLAASSVDKATCGRNFWATL